MHDLGNRRPLASRQTDWAAAATRRLAASGITPNQISILGMVFAAMAGLAFFLGATADEAVARGVLFAVAAAGCQARLLCNLFDGMVAVEGGKASPDGGFWNEFPDRMSDMLILCGIGYGADAAGLGWAATAMAFLTAYVRELGRNCGLPADFSGPMAKQHRMAVVTVAALATALAPAFGARNEILVAALWLVAAGAGFTALRRSWRTVAALRARAR
jgi:phosphatidylglycerophosphate synthase